MQSRPQISIRLAMSFIGLAVVVSGFIVSLQLWQHEVEKSNDEMSVISHRLERPLPPPDDYAGGMSCRRCHQEIWDRYQSHPMSHSSATTQDALSLEDFTQKTSFDVQSSIGITTYSVEKTPDGQFHHESLTDTVFGQIYDQRVKVDYAIGSGHGGRSYILIENDCMFVSPISWYSQGAKWDLSPGYLAGKHPRFERRVIQSCIVCHTGRVSIDREAVNRFPSPGIIEAGISCEKCHGPGTDHIKFHERIADSADQPQLVAVDPIINPIKLESSRREGVCWQCHFSATERIPRYGRIDADFRPGMNFEEIWVAFVRKKPTDRDAVRRPANHVEQTTTSVCFQRSDGRFGCLSCHDAHSTPSPEEKGIYYRQKCLACHADRGCSVSVDVRIQQSETDSCTDCHMPSRHLNTVPHTSQTDHQIMRKPFLESSDVLGSELEIFRETAHHIPQIEQDRAWGLVLAKAAEMQKDVTLARSAEQKLSAIQSAIPDDNQVLECLGACELLLGQREIAQKRWREILNRSPNNEGALRRLAELSLEEGDLPAARDALIRYLEINQWQSEYKARLAAVYGRLGDLDAAIRLAQESLRINPALAWAHGIMIEAYQRKGMQSEADRHLQLYKRLDLSKQRP